MTANNPALTETAQKKSPKTHGEPILIVLSVAVVLLGGSTAAAVVIYAKKTGSSESHSGAAYGTLFC